MVTRIARGGRADPNAQDDRAALWALLNRLNLLSSVFVTDLEGFVRARERPRCWKPAIASLLLRTTFSETSKSNNRCERRLQSNGTFLYAKLFLNFHACRMTWVCLIRQFVQVPMRTHGFRLVLVAALGLKASCGCFGKLVRAVSTKLIISQSKLSIVFTSKS